MALGAENEKPAGGSYVVVFFVGLRFVTDEDFIPLVGWNHVFIAGVIPDRTLAVVHFGLNLALSGAQWLGNSLFDAFLLGRELGIAAQKNVGSAARHVSGNRDHAFTAGLRNDLRLTLVIFGVQDDVPDIFFLQQFGKPLRFFDGGGAHQNRLPGLVEFLDLIRGREIFFLLCPVNYIRIFFPQ